MPLGRKRIDWRDQRIRYSERQADKGVADTAE
jgi:hypothetical protein